MEDLEERIAEAQETLWRVTQQKQFDLQDPAVLQADCALDALVAQYIRRDMDKRKDKTGK